MFPQVFTSLKHGKDGTLFLRILGAAVEIERQGQNDSGVLQATRRRYHGVYEQQALLAWPLPEGIDLLPGGQEDGRVLQRTCWRWYGQCQ